VTQRSRLRTVARRFAYTQALAAALTALFAVYLAVMTSEDAAATGAASLDGPNVTEFAYFAICAAAVAATLIAAARRAYGDDGRAWWWVSIVCQTVIAGWLAVVAARSLSDLNRAVVWSVAVLLTLGAVSGLVRKGSRA
jgi:uncharacterized membrane protein YhaH (DUF805 family)